MRVAGRILGSGQLSRRGELDHGQQVAMLPESSNTITTSIPVAAGMASCARALRGYANSRMSPQISAGDSREIFVFVINTGPVCSCARILLICRISPEGASSFQYRSGGQYSAKTPNTQLCFGRVRIVAKWARVTLQSNCDGARNGVRTVDRHSASTPTRPTLPQYDISTAVCPRASPRPTPLGSPEPPRQPSETSLPITHLLALRRRNFAKARSPKDQTQDSDAEAVQQAILAQNTNPLGTLSLCKSYSLSDGDSVFAAFARPRLI